MKRLVALLITFALVLTFSPVVAGAEAAPVTIEVYIVNPWVTSELPPKDTDIYRNYLLKKFNANVDLSYSSEGESELLTRFAAGNAPDLIAFNSYSSLSKFYEQGVLLDDWKQYADKITPFLDKMGADQQTYFTTDGKLIAVATQPGQQSFAWMIRQDWLNALGLSMPTTTDELFNVLKAFTFNDPDKNGVNDTYGITSAGGGDSVGEVGNLLAFFGDLNWYLGADGQVNHPLLDGTYEQYLTFLKSLYDAGVIDPNWYTQGWEERKSELFAGTFGMCWYPPDALLDENRTSRGDEAADEWWTVLPMFSGKLPSASITGNSILTVSTECAADPAKMDVIFNMMNTFITSNDAYYELRRSVNIDGQYMERINDNTVYVWRDKEGTPNKQLDSVEGSYIACALYGQIFGTYADGYFGGNTKEIAPHTKKMMDLVGVVNGMERYGTEKQFLALDATLLEETNMVLQEYTINYVLGSANDYEGFKQKWLAAGGEELKQVVHDTWVKYGFIKE